MPHYTRRAEAERDLPPDPEPVAVPIEVRASIVVPPGPQELRVERVERVPITGDAALREGEVAVLPAVTWSNGAPPATPAEIMAACERIRQELEALAPGPEVVGRCAPWPGPWSNTGDPRPLTVEALLELRRRVLARAGAPLELEERGEVGPPGLPVVRGRVPVRE